MDLKQRLEDLPRELYEYIYELTFTSDTKPRSIWEGYHPPSTLQVSHETRRSFARQFYHGRDDALFFCWDHEKCLRWLLSLPREHVALLREVRCATQPTSWLLDCVNYTAKTQRSHILQQLYKRGVFLDAKVLYFQICPEEGANSVWTNKL